MKTVLLGDVHFDSASGNPNVLEQKILFFEKQLVPYCVEHDINTILQLGDLFDNRQHITLNTIDQVSKRVLSLLDKHGITMYTLVGNHDMYYKTTRDVHSLHLFAQAHKCLVPVEEQQTIELHNRKIQCVPYLVDGEQFIPDETCDFIIGHFDIKDFHITRSTMSTHGLTKDVFKNIPVYSGHYHIYQKMDNVTYVGTPNQENWSDFGLKKGFMTMDMETLETEFIENVYSTKHIKCHIDVENKTVTIDDGESIVVPVNKVDAKMFENNKLKIYATKELAIVKKFVEMVDGLCRDWKLEILVEDVEGDIDTIVETAKTYDIEERLVAVNDENDGEMLHDILTEAKSMMVE